MNVNFEKNREYYSSPKSTPCDCELCKNFYAKIKEAYPEVDKYLSSLCVDICKPFELVCFENEEKHEVEYIGCQYIVFGNCEKDFKKQIGDVKFEINTDGHPDDSDIQGEHFVLDFGTITLKYK